MQSFERDQLYQKAIYARATSIRLRTHNPGVVGWVWVEGKKNFSPKGHHPLAQGSSIHAATLGS
ncbi:hypothetical protein CCP3SC1_10002 [Gammaproteobacteria bacterium]